MEYVSGYSSRKKKNSDDKCDDFYWKGLDQQQ